MATKDSSNNRPNSHRESKTPVSKEIDNSDDDFSKIKELNSSKENDEYTPSLRKRTLSILDVFEQTLCTQECRESENKPEDELSEITEQEEVDIGDIAFDIAIEAVDDITKIKERLGNRIDKFNKEKDKIITKAKARIDYKVNQAQTLRFIDKLTFFFGVILIYLDVY